MSWAGALLSPCCRTVVVQLMAQQPCHQQR
jgi:hypothetical protein